MFPLLMLIVVSQHKIKKTSSTKPFLSLSQTTTKEKTVTLRHYKNYARDINANAPHTVNRRQQHMSRHWHTAHKLIGFWPQLHIRFLINLNGAKTFPDKHVSTRRAGITGNRSCQQHGEWDLVLWLQKHVGTQQLISHWKTRSQSTSRCSCTNIRVHSVTGTAGNVCSSLSMSSVDFSVYSVCCTSESLYL